MYSIFEVTVYCVQELLFSCCHCHLGLSALDNTLHKELNECFLLHGTASSSVDAIARLGLDIRLSRDTALYGRGIYLAESLDKAFMYTGSFCVFDDLL